MALDFELLRKELEEAQKQRAADFWVPEMGENLVRILPPRDGKLFYKKVGVHYRLLDSGVEFCPKVTAGARCPVCETVEGLRKLGTPGALELVRRFLVTERYMMNVIVLSSDVKDIKQYLAPKTVRLELLKIILDPDYGDITDLETGRNVVIEKVQASKGFVNYIVRAKPNQVPLRSVIGREIRMEEIPTFDEIVKGRMRSYEELKEILFGGEDTMGLEGLVERYMKEEEERREERRGEEGREVSDVYKEGEREEKGEENLDMLLKRALEALRGMNVKV